MMKSDIVKYYETCGSIKETAKVFGISSQKTRKILITEGAFESETSKTVNDMYAKGYSIDDISHKLQMSKTCVSSYLPYTKGIYNSDAPSENALKLRKWRKDREN